MISILGIQFSRGENLPLIKIGGLSLVVASGAPAAIWHKERLCLASYHPKSSKTWWWSLSLYRNDFEFTDKGYIYNYMLSVRGNPYCSKANPLMKWMSRPQRRAAHWSDHYRMGFGWVLCLTRQDYHKQPLKPSIKP